jgi:hypothetical protein
MGNSERSSALPTESRNSRTADSQGISTILLSLISSLDAKSPSHSVSTPSAPENLGFRADDGQTAPYCLSLRPKSPYGCGALDLAIETASIQVARLGCIGRQDFIVSVAG